MNYTTIEQGKELEKIFGKEGADGVYCNEIVNGENWDWVHHQLGEEYFGDSYVYDSSDIPSWSLEALLRKIFKRKPDSKFMIKDGDLIEETYNYIIKIYGKEE